MKNLYIYNTIYNYIATHCPDGTRLPYDLNKEIILFDKYIFSSSISMSALKAMSNFLESLYMTCNWAEVNDNSCKFSFGRGVQGRFLLSFNLNCINHKFIFNLRDYYESIDLYSQDYTDIELFETVLWDPFKEWVEN